MKLNYVMAFGLFQISTNPW